MRRGIKNDISISVVGMDLTLCSDITLYVKQNGRVYEYTGTVDSTDNSVVTFVIPKTDAVNFRKGIAKIQLALTDSSNKPRSHEPIEVRMGDLLKEDGYGS